MPRISASLLQLVVLGRQLGEDLLEVSHGEVALQGLHILALLWGCGVGFGGLWGLGGGLGGALGGALGLRGCGLLLSFFVFCLRGGREPLPKLYIKLKSCPSCMVVLLVSVCSHQKRGTLTEHPHLGIGHAFLIQDLEPKGDHLLELKY